MIRYMIILLVLAFIGCESHDQPTNVASDQQAAHSKPAVTQEKASVRANRQPAKRSARQAAVRPAARKQSASKVDRDEEAIELLPFKLDDYSEF